MTGLSIGQLARRADVNVDTLRYYERRALLPSPPRTAAGYRAYAPDAVRRVRFIKRAQRLGFTLDEIGDLLALRVTPGASCEAVEAKARETVARIDTKMMELEQMRSALSSLAATCRGRSADPCPILQALEPADADRNHGDD
jgi:Hg(II)-responsive transcriptional regulator